MNADVGIENLTEYNEALTCIQNLDVLINKYYNELPKKTKQDDIVHFQDMINKLQEKRRGFFQLTVIFQKQNNPKKTIQEYFCKKGDTLPLISQAYFGNSDFWQYIYYENSLTNPILVPNQKLIIPFISSSAPLILGAKMIALIENDRINKGID